MSTEAGAYDHLNKTTPVTVETTVDVQAVVRAVEASNYGAHRLISALIKARVEHATRAGWGEDHEKMQMVKVLTKMLEDGIY
jgi:hypothetical protein